MKVLYPDGVHEFELKDVSSGLSRVVEQLISPGVPRASWGDSLVPWTVEGYWVIPTSEKGTPVLRIDIKMKEMKIT